MKRRYAGLLALFLCLLLTACAGPTPAADAQSSVSPAETVVFTDDLGREVEAPYQPQRVAALIGSFASVWQLSGGQVTATANDAWTQFDLGLDDSVVNLGTTTSASLEKLVSSDPQLVIASCNTKLNLDWMSTLEDMGIPVAYFDVNRFEDYLNMLEICTRITGRDDLYQENGLDVAQQVEDAIARAEGMEGPTVLYLRATASSVKAKSSEGTVLGEMLSDLGCQNIADGDSLLESLSLERIVQADPDLIFIVMQGSDQPAVEERLLEELTGNPAWAGLTAVQKNLVYFMDQQLYNLKPNNRWGDAYEQLAEILYGPAQN